MEMTKECAKFKYIDLSHTIEDGTVTFPGDIPVSIETILDREAASKLNGDGPYSGVEINTIRMVSTSGTYIDAPYHVFADGKQIKDYPIEKLVNLPSVVVKIADNREYFDAEDIDGLHVEGKAVLFYTGHDKFFMTPEYGKNAPYLTVELANALVGKGAVFVGIDTPLIDNMSKLSDVGTPVHYTLLGANIPICEDMTNLQLLPADGFTITALPPAVALESFPARVFATVLESPIKE
ncbi:cyclase family protein [Bacillus paralicheniformis]|uniref:cyclase family protein n=1 Tax=Bacillus paralicheniformis TaxID=1648923 RepID=UPI002E2270E6|nr:cyclase family protein [Bacillus paralicheniformis]